MIEKLKQNKLVLIIFIMAILLIVTGVTYSFYKIRLEGQKTHFVSSDLISFTYKESENKISITNMTPVSDTDGKKSNYFEFSVSSNLVKDMSVDYEISILKTSTTNSFNEEDIKTYLTDENDNSLVEPVIISELEDNSKITNAKTIYQNNFTYNNSNEKQTHTYRLRIWLKNDVDLSKYTTKTETENGTNVTLENHSFKFKVNVNTYEKTSIAIDKIISLTNNKDNSGLYTITHEADSTLQIGSTESITEYRYRGTNPKNYVTFNNEAWRIIGIFPVDDGTGNIENRIKIIRNESIGYNSWDNGTTAYNYGKQDNILLLINNDDISKTNFLEKTDNYDIIMTAPEFCDGTNNWARPASLNTYLNGTYLPGLTSEAQSMIGNAKYYLGGYSDFNINSIQMYQYERKISGSTYYYGTNQNSWTGKLGLMYVSDYGYASSNCESNKLYDSTSNGTLNDVRACNDINWLYGVINSGNSLGVWTITEHIASNAFKGRSVFYYIDGSFSSMQVCGTGSSMNTYPTLYLTSNVQITGGSGTSTDPYTLGI